jgi:hypothetical protein
MPVVSASIINAMVPANAGSYVYISRVDVYNSASCEICEIDRCGS